MNVKEAGTREGEVANWSDCVGKVSSAGRVDKLGPKCGSLLNGWPHEAFGDDLSRCLNTGVAEGVQRVENLTAEGRRYVWAWFTRRSVAVQLD